MGGGGKAEQKAAEKGGGGKLKAKGKRKESGFRGSQSRFITGVTLPVDGGFVCYSGV